MAETVTQFPGSRGRKFDNEFKQYFDGQIWKITLVDHPTYHSAHSLQSTIRQVAKNRNTAIKLSMRGEVIYLQAVPAPVEVSV